ncbi:hypothetical protein Bbelb_266300 [Branchiostoma belcheri]|nr:hypothetical protein Bbelb_266300 [Branchiostoma belcheri]
MKVKVTTWPQQDHSNISESDHRGRRVFSADIKIHLAGEPAVVSKCKEPCYKTNGTQFSNSEYVSDSACQPQGTSQVHCSPGDLVTAAVEPDGRCQQKNTRQPNGQQLTNLPSALLLMLTPSGQRKHAARRARSQCTRREPLTLPGTRSHDGDEWMLYI